MSKVNKQDILRKILTVMCAITYKEDIEIFLKHLKCLSFEDKVEYSNIILAYNNKKINFKELQYKIVEALIQDKVDLNENVEFLFRDKKIIIKPLYAVCIAKKDAELTELMFNNGANINATGKQFPIIFELANFIENTHNIVEKTKLIEVFKVIIASNKFNIHEEQFIVEYGMVNTQVVSHCDKVGLASFFQLIIAYKNTDIIKILFDNNKIDLNIKIAGYDLISYVNEILQRSDDPKDEELIDLFNAFVCLEEQKILNETKICYEQMKVPYENYLTLSAINNLSKYETNLAGKEEVFTNVWEQD